MEERSEKTSESFMERIMTRRAQRNRHAEVRSVRVFRFFSRDHIEPVRRAKSFVRIVT